MSNSDGHEACREPIVMSYIHEHTSTHTRCIHVCAGVYARMRIAYYADGRLTGYAGAMMQAHAHLKIAKQSFAYIGRASRNSVGRNGDEMNGYGLYWGDFLAIGILFSVIGILLVAFVWDYVDIKIADRRSAELDQHWATTIREER